MRIVACAAFTLVATSAVAATTLEVPLQYATIQGAVDAADNGDTILVDPGVYYGTIVVNDKTVTLASRFHTTGNPEYIAQTVIDGNDNSAAIEIDASNGMNYIVGFTIRNADDGIIVASPLTVLYSKITETKDAIDFESGSWGSIVRGSVISKNRDDAIDFDGTSYGIIENNILTDNRDDGIEIRLPRGIVNAPPSYHIRNNIITGNGEDGIQVIAYGGGPSNRSIVISGNLIADNGMAGLGLMCCDQTVENYVGSDHPERYLVYNNTFRNNNHAITGGDNLFVVNNVFVGHEVALKRLRINSVAAHNIFHANTVNLLDAIADQSTNLFADPDLAENGALLPGSPAIDRGITSYIRDGEEVLSIPRANFTGSAPDLGAFEIDGNNPWIQPAYVPVTGDAAGAHEIAAHDGNRDGMATINTANSGIPAPANAAPRLSILTPLPGFTIDDGLAAIFSAEATDAEDGDISSEIFWDSNVDGPIGTGASLSANLSLGEHLITAEVFDSDGASDTKYVEMTVMPPDNSSPNLSVVMPASGHIVVSGEAVVFSATASDAEEGDISEYVRWSSSVDGSLGTGATINALLSLGNHLVTATVSDDRGATISKSLTIRVEQSESGGLAPGIVMVRIDQSTDDAEEDARGDLSVISPDIELTYDYGNQLIGLRFRGIDIPTGSMIDDAYIQFYADESTSIPTRLKIAAENTSDAETFATTKFNISRRKLTGNKVTWEPEPWNDEFPYGEQQRTPDLRKIVQEIVNSPDWKPGNAIAFIISGEGERVAESFDGQPNAAATLHVRYRAADSTRKPAADKKN